MHACVGQQPHAASGLRACVHPRAAQSSCQQLQLASRLMPLTSPRPGSSVASLPAQPPGISASVGSEPVSTRMRQEDVLWSSAPKTPFVSARLRSTSWHSFSVRTLVSKASKRRPTASVQRPWPMNTGMPLALTSSSKASAAAASSAAPASHVTQMSKMQSLSIRASWMLLHLLWASFISASGQCSTASSNRWSSVPGDLLISGSVASRRAAVSAKDLGVDLPLKRFRLDFTGPKSSPMGKFQEGTTGVASSSGSPFRLPQ
mmetsp:Transcript_16136/g.48650  ORF Transcript_16136/g.48650 Transcript_16136/m.48650 type:complete len:261 (-) Transcript_16136:972-1754(-)